MMPKLCGYQYPNEPQGVTCAAVAQADGRCLLHNRDAMARNEAIQSAFDAVTTAERTFLDASEAAASSLCVDDDTTTTDLGPMLTAYDTLVAARAALAALTGETEGTRNA